MFIEVKILRHGTQITTVKTNAGNQDGQKANGAAKETAPKKRSKGQTIEKRLLRF